MRFVCDQETLAAWLKKAALFTDPRSPIAIYGFVKLTVVPGCLTLETLNSSFGFTAAIQLTDIVPATPGSTCVQADRIADLVAALRPNCSIEMFWDNQLHVRSGRTRVALDTLSTDSFPVFDQSFRNPQIVTHTAELDRVLGRTIPAMENDADRAMLWGLSLQYHKDRIAAAACDGTIFAICTLFHEQINEFPAAIIPRPVCLKLRTVLKGSTGEIGISINPNAVKFTTNQWTVISKLVDQIYPPHADLIAPLVANPVILNNSEFLAILHRVEAATDFDKKKLKQRGAAIAFDNQVMSVRDGHQTFHDQMEVIYSEPGPEEIGFNTLHMAEALQAIDALEVELHFSDRNSRIRVCAAGDTEESFTTMPYRM